MLQVSTGALASIILILVICFILPIGVYYLLFRLADGKIKTFGIGAAAYFIGGFVAEILLLSAIRLVTDLNSNIPMYVLYTVVLSPAVFLAVNYATVKWFGGDIATTGDSLMYGAGYTTLQNLITAGFISAWYLVELLDMKALGGRYIVVSDGDYVSMSHTVSASNLVSESMFDEMRELCSTPPSYFLSLALDRVWIVVIYTAMLLVVWLAARKASKLPLLGIAFGMKVLSGIPAMLSDFGMISSKWVSIVILLVTAVMEWTAAVFCWRQFIDGEEEEKEEEKEEE